MKILIQFLLTAAVLKIAYHMIVRYTFAHA
jgi:hypothetical protein